MISRKAGSRSRTRMQWRIVPAARASLHDGLFRAPRTASRAVARSGDTQGTVSPENAGAASGFGAGCGKHVRPAQRSVSGPAGPKAATASSLVPPKLRAAREPGRAAGFAGTISPDRRAESERNAIAGENASGVEPVEQVLAQGGRRHRARERRRTA